MPGDTVQFYGIPNCDTVKKARTWLDAQGIPYVFHNYKTEGVDAALLARWVDRVGWEVLLNKAGTTFRKLPDAEKQGIDAKKAQALMIANPSIIKRPVVELTDGLIVGFSPDRYAQALGVRA